MQQGQNGVSYAIPHKYQRILITISSSPRNGIDFFVFFLAALRGLWDLCSLTRDWTPGPPQCKGRVLTIAGNCRNLKPVNLKRPDRHCQATCLIDHYSPLKERDFTVTNPLFCLVQLPYSCFPLATKIFHFIGLP